MRIYYIKKDEILNKIPLRELEKFSDGHCYKNKEKYLEHLLGLYLIKLIGSKYYELNDTTITYNGKKPVFASGEINFSISHCENIVAVGFCKNNIGIDIEKMKERDFKKLAKRYNISPTKDSFYKFWTNYEAEIKLGEIPVKSITQIFENDYMLTYVTNKKSDLNVELIKLT